MLGFYTLGLQLSQFVNHLANEINNSGHGKKWKRLWKGMDVDQEAWMLVGYVWKGMEEYGRVWKDKDEHRLARKGMGGHQWA